MKETALGFTRSSFRISPIDPPSPKYTTDRTYAFYEQMLEIHTIPRLGEIQLDKLKPLHLQQYYSTLKKDGRLDGKPGGLAPSTVSKHHAIIHKALKTAFKWELVAQNVSDKVEVPKKKKVKVSFYTSEEANVMLDFAKKTKRYNELLVAVYTGMRRGEIYGLRFIWPRDCLHERRRS